MIANESNTRDGRTETERFTDDVDAAALIEGDQIDKRLVARHPSQLGDPIQRTPPNHDDYPDTQLVVVTELDSMHDTHTAILYDPDAEMFVRAGRHDSQQAWTQAEADWTVREVGTEVVVDEVHDLERPEEERDQDADAYVQEWVEILFDDVRHSGGDPDIRDERELDGRTLVLNDYDGRKTLATISLSDDE